MRKRGFTLIELLVAIAIIGILAALVITNLASAKRRARDTKRITAISQINTSIQLYYNNNDVYPSKPDGCNSPVDHYSTDGADRWIVSSPACVGGNWIKGIVPDYMSQLPTDPGPKYIKDTNPGKNRRGYVYYVSEKDASCYKIMATDPEDCASQPDMIDPNREGEYGGKHVCWAWAKYSPGCKYDTQTLATPIPFPVSEEVYEEVLE